MPALPARSAGIYVETIQLIVINNFENVGVPANKELRTTVCKFLFYFRGISSRVAADVRHEDFHVLAVPGEFFRIDTSYIVAINVSVHTFQRKAGLSCQLISNGDGAKVAGMPNFIAVFEVFKYPFIQVAVGV